jgi:hypothetical protein
MSVFTRSYSYFASCGRSQDRVEGMHHACMTPMQIEMSPEREASFAASCGVGSRLSVVVAAPKNISFKRRWQSANGAPGKTNLMVMRMTRRTRRGLQLSKKLNYHVFRTRDYIDRARMAPKCSTSCKRTNRLQSAAASFKLTLSMHTSRPMHPEHLG